MIVIDLTLNKSLNTTKAELESVRSDVMNNFAQAYERIQFTLKAATASDRLMEIGLKASDEAMEFRLNRKIENLSDHLNNLCELSDERYDKIKEAHNTLLEIHRDDDTSMREFVSDMIDIYH